MREHTQHYISDTSPHFLSTFRGRLASKDIIKPENYHFNTKKKKGGGLLPHMNYSLKTNYTT